MSKQLKDYSPMEQMELFIRSKSDIREDGYDAETRVFTNSQLLTREVVVPAGEVILGKIHKEWSVNILSSGSLFLIADPTSKQMVRIDAPYIFESGPNSQKLGMAITNCVFINVMKTNKNETVDEALDRMVEDTAITKEIKCQ